MEAWHQVFTYVGHVLIEDQAISNNQILIDCLDCFRNSTVSIVYSFEHRVWISLYAIPEPAGSRALILLAFWHSTC